MMRLKLHKFIPDTWLEIAAASFDAWDKRDQQEPFLSNNRRDYARITPVGLSSAGVPGQTLPSADQCPLLLLGFRDEQETAAQFTSYVWSSWTSKTVQPMHVDQSLQDMLNRLAQGSASTCANQSKSSGQMSIPSVSENKGSNEPPAQSTQSKDERKGGSSKESSSDERERESPDTTSKPEGKSLKTSGTTSSTQQIAKGQGTHTDDKSERPVLLKSNQLCKGLKLIGDMLRQNPVRTCAGRARRMHRLMPSWKLKEFVKLLFLIAKMTDVHFPEMTGS